MHFQSFQEFRKYLKINYCCSQNKGVRNPFLRAWLRFTSISHATSHIDLVSTRDIAAQMLEIRKRYTLTAAETHLAMSRPYPYLTAAQSHRFVEVSTEAVSTAVVRYLESDGSNAAVDKHSFLDRTDIVHAREAVWESAAQGILL